MASAKKVAVLDKVAALLALVKKRPWEKKKVVVVLSGGQDSTTCLFYARAMGAELHAVTFNYGQRHKRELQSACKVAALANVASHRVVALGDHVLEGTSPLISDSRLEQYKDHASLPGGLEKTFVPMRNQLFLTLAMNRAAVLGAASVVTGVCQEDYGGYPDCRERFISILEQACNEGLTADDTRHHLTIETPLMHLTKAESIFLALALPGCYPALAWSHTSYDGAYPPVGHDHATLLRAKGFEESGFPDPLVLRAWREGSMPLPETSNYHDARLAAAALGF